MSLNMTERTIRRALGRDPSAAKRVTEAADEIKFERAMRRITR
jgi:hypothetical protein